MGIVDGGAGDDDITGSLSHDVLLGGSGNDVIGGRDGNDRLEGGVGDDTLEGGAGDDHLVGGAGDDTLTGGAGKDTFVFNSLNEGVDHITDFYAVDIRALIPDWLYDEMPAAALENLERSYAKLEDVIQIDASGFGATSKSQFSLQSGGRLLFEGQHFATLAGNAANNFSVEHNLVLV